MMEEPYPPQGHFLRHLRIEADTTDPGGSVGRIPALADLCGSDGTLHIGAVAAALDVTAPVAAFEIFLDALPPEKRKSRARPAMVSADLLPVRRDFAFVLDEAVPAGDVVKAAAAADKALITDVSLFDVFSGKSLGAGKKSVAIEVTLQPRERTLTDPEIEAVSKKVIAEVKRATGGEIRG